MKGDSLKFTTEEYHLAAKKLIAKIAPRNLKQVFLSDEQIVGEVATELMLADENYDEGKCDNAHMWRYLCAYWIIGTLVKKKKRKNIERSFSPTSQIEGSDSARESSESAYNLMELAQTVEIPEVERISLIFAYEHGYSMVELAKLFRCTPKEAGRRITKALGSVREALKPYL